MSIMRLVLCSGFARLFKTEVSAGDLYLPADAPASYVAAAVPQRQGYGGIILRP